MECIYPVKIVRNVNMVNHEFVCLCFAVFSGAHSRFFGPPLQVGLTVRPATGPLIIVCPVCL